jgi:hypothetical protein
MLFDLDYVTPSNQNPWRFLVNTVTPVLFRLYRNSLPIFDYNRILCIISTARLSLLLIETTRMYIATAVTNLFYVQ